MTAIPPDLPLSNSDVERQVFINQSGNVAATYLENGAGIVYSNGDGSGPGSDPYNWLISNNVLTISQAGEADFTYTAKNIEGNKYTFYGSQDQQSEIYFRGLPFSISELDGKIYDLDITDDQSCTAATIKFNGNSIILKEICGGANETIPITITEDANFENVLIFTSTNSDGSVSVGKFVKIAGDTSSLLKIAAIETKDGVFDEIFTDTWTITDAEAF